MKPLEEQTWTGGARVGSYQGTLIASPMLRFGQFDFLTALHRLASVPRWSGDTILPWTVLDHTMLCYYLARKRRQDPGVCAALLVHDLHEAYFPHDVPAPLLKQEPLLMELEEHNIAVVRLAFAALQIAENDYVRAVEFDDLARNIEAALLLAPALAETVGVGLTKKQLEDVAPWFRKKLGVSKPRQGQYVEALVQSLAQIGARPIDVLELVSKVFDEARAWDGCPQRKLLLSVEEALRLDCLRAQGLGSYWKSADILAEEQSAQPIQRSPIQSDESRPLEESCTRSKETS